jgi:hypothetical protein
MKTCFSVLGFITAAVVGIVIVVSLLAANSTPYSSRTPARPASSAVSNVHVSSCITDKLELSEKLSSLGTRIQSGANDGQLIFDPAWKNKTLVMAAGTESAANAAYSSCKESKILKVAEALRLFRESYRDNDFAGVKSAAAMLQSAMD